MRLLDTNVFLRYLTRDDEEKAQRCFELFQRLKNGDETATTTEAIIAEVVFVLSSRRLYGLSHEDIRARLLPILGIRGLKLRQKRVYFRALDIYVAHPALDFEDALSVATVQVDGVQEIYSYDRDFDRVEGIVRLEP
ncbi:MAG TPA: type II toxin-antitoxin system VapC family toxin [Chloroflexota bacterium]|nr:type II toxin-antitoxin system VapC family toxin [Chloroflexota bacterium]